MIYRFNVINGRCDSGDVVIVVAAGTKEEAVSVVQKAKDHWAAISKKYAEAWDIYKKLEQMMNTKNEAIKKLLSIQKTRSLSMVEITKLRSLYAESETLTQGLEAANKALHLYRVPDAFSREIDMEPAQENTIAGIPDLTWFGSFY